MLISTFVVTVLFISSINPRKIEDKSSSTVAPLSTDVIQQWLRQFHSHSRNRKIDVNRLFHKIFHSNTQLQARISNCSNVHNQFTDIVGQSEGKIRLERISPLKANDLDWIKNQSSNTSNQRKRMRRAYFKENAIDNEADITNDGEGIQTYEDDGARLDNQQEGRVYNVEYYRPARKNSKIKNDDDSYLNDYRDEEINRNVNMKDRFLNQEGLSDDYLFDRNPDSHRQRVKIDRKLDRNGKKFREKTTIEKDFDENHFRENSRKRRLKALEQARREKKDFDKKDEEYVDDSNVNEEEDDK